MISVWYIGLKFFTEQTEFVSLKGKKIKDQVNFKKMIYVLIVHLTKFTRNLYF